MSDVDDEESRPQSKFEWRPGDVVILSPEESRAALAEYEEWLAQRDEESTSNASTPQNDGNDVNL